jgi:hypothetical protein
VKARDWKQQRIRMKTVCNEEWESNKDWPRKDSNQSPSSKDVDFVMSWYETRDWPERGLPSHHMDKTDLAARRRRPAEECRHSDMTDANPLLWCPTNHFEIPTEQTKSMGKEQVWIKALDAYILFSGSVRSQLWPDDTKPQCCKQQHPWSI